MDGQELVSVSALGDGSTLDVEGKLYVGGLPIDYVAKNLGNVRFGEGWGGLLSDCEILECVYCIKHNLFSILYLTGVKNNKEWNNNEHNDSLLNKSFWLSMV